MKKIIFSISCIILSLCTSAQSPYFQWAQSFGGTTAQIKSIAIDGSGNVYTTGYFSGTADFDPGAGTFNLTAAGGDDIYIYKLDASGNFLWAKRMGGTLGDYGWSVKADVSGNVYTTGYFNGTADFDPGTGAFNLTSAGSEDIFISKLDASGNFVWAIKIGGTFADLGQAITITSSGIYTTGIFRGTVDFDPGASTFNVPGVGFSGHIFVLKLDASGNFIWAKQLSGSNGEAGWAIAADASGNVYTTGHFWGTVDFDPGTGAFNLTSAGSEDIFISKLDASGNFVWAKQMGGASSNLGRSIAVDASGNVYTTGTFLATCDFDPGAAIFNLTSAGNNDIFISKLNDSGNFIWAKRIGGANHDVAYSMVLDSSGNVYTTGIFSDTADFDPGAGTFNLTSVGGHDIYIYKLDASGNFIWAGQLGGTLNQGGTSITSDNQGNVYTAGYFLGTVDFDPGPGVYNLSAIGSPGVFIQKMDNCALANISPGGPITICPGGSVLLNANTGTGLTYQWKNNGVNISGQTNSSYTANSSGNYTVVVTNSGNCSATSSPVVVTNDIVAPVVANCPSNFTSCNPVSWVPPQFTDNCAFTVTSNYLPGSFFPPGVYTITYTAIDTGNNTTVCNFDVTVIAAPLSPDSISSNMLYNNICVNESITLTVHAASPLFQGTWEWFTGNCSGTPLPAYSGMSSITVSPLVTTTYFVRSVNSCNTTTCLSLTVKVNNNPPGTLSVVSMPPIGYIGGSGTIVCNVDPDAVFYRWRLLNGPQNAVLFNGSIGPVETTTNSVIVDFLQTQNKYNIRVFSGNACGRSNNANISINGTVEPAACLNGPVIVCPLQNATYSVLACPIPNATGYQWTIQPPSAGTITSGQGSSVINVNFAAGYTSAQICVAGLSPPNNVGPQTCITVTPTSSVVGAIDGDLSPCSGSTESYNVMPVSGATGYLWTTTIPGAVVSGTSTTGTVQFPAGPFTGNLCVQSLTACGPSLPSCASITSVTPGVPGPITGPVSNLCGASNINYFLSTSDANSYTWILPPGITLASGGSSNSILVNFNTGTIGPQTISVQATYDCNVAASSIIVDGTPTTPVVTPTTICPGTEQFYSASSGGPGMTYSWITTGATVFYCINPTCSQFYVEWLTSGNSLSVTASNSCGTSAVYNVPNNCRIVNEELPENRIYPNPTDGIFTLEFKSLKEEIRNILITDQTGRIVLKEDVSSKTGMTQHLLNLESVQPGIYNLMLRDGDGNFWMERITLIR